MYGPRYIRRDHVINWPRFGWWHRCISTKVWNIRWMKSEGSGLFISVSLPHPRHVCSKSRHLVSTLWLNQPEKGWDSQFVTKIKSMDHNTGLQSTQSFSPWYLGFFSILCWNLNVCCRASYTLERFNHLNIGISILQPIQIYCQLKNISWSCSVQRRTSF